MEAKSVIRSAAVRGLFPQVVAELVLKPAKKTTGLSFRLEMCCLKLGFLISFHGGDVGYRKCSGIQKASFLLTAKSTVASNRKTGQLDSEKVDTSMD